MRILLRGLGLAGEYACDILRAKGFARGNGDFGVDEVGGNGDSNGCVTTLGMICAGAGATAAPLSVEEEEACGGGCTRGGGNGGVVDGARRSVAGCGGGRDSGDGGGRTNDVGRSDVGTVEGITSVSKDASRTTRLLVPVFVVVVVVFIRRLEREWGSERREPDAARFADTMALAAFKGDLSTAFPLDDFERVFRGERRDGPGPGCCCATAGAGTGTGRAGTRFSGFLQESKSRFFGLGCSIRF
jgi:hypothetical protein